MRRVALFAAIVAVAAATVSAQSVSISPDPAQAGSTATVTYDPADGDLAGSAAINLHYGFNDFSVVANDAAMTDNGGVWEVTVDIPSPAENVSLTFYNGEGVWDSNDGANYNFDVAGGSQGTAVSISPDPAAASQMVTVTYDSAGGPLVGVTDVYLHYGFNGFNPTQPDVQMTPLGGGVFQASVLVKSYASTLDVTFNDTGADSPTTVWDTNGGFNWSFDVTGTIPGVQVSPNPPVAGEEVTVTYNTEDAVLEGADQIVLHWGYNEYQEVFDVDMTSNGDGVWEATVMLPIRACQMAFTFNDGGDPAVWDNNNGNDWGYEVDGCIPAMNEAQALHLAKREGAGGRELVVGIPGSIQANSSAMVIFINTPGRTGQTELDVLGAPTPPDLMQQASPLADLNACQRVGSGTMLPGEADYALYINYSGSAVFLNEYQLYDFAFNSLSCCGGGSLDVYAWQEYAGSTPANDGNEVVEDDPEGKLYFLSYNDTNTTGLTAEGPGLEVGIPLAFIGYGLGSSQQFSIFVGMMPNVDGVRGQFSNQFLPSATGPTCANESLFPLRADLSTYTSVRTVTSWNSLATFSGDIDGIVEASEYNDPNVVTQTCEPAEAVANTMLTAATTPTRGEMVDLYYVNTNGPLDGLTDIQLHYGFDGDLTSPTVIPMAATNGFTGHEFKATVSIPANALQLDAYVSSQSGPVDDNDGQNWHFRVVSPPVENAVELNPDPAQAGQNVTITYDPTGGPLEGSNEILIHYGFNGWAPVIDPDESLSQTDDCRWEITVPVLPSALGQNGLNMVFYNENGTYDNNDGSDFNFPVENNTIEQPPFVMDGEVDCGAKLIAVSSNGVNSLWAGYQGGYLYVATNRSDLDNARDHFIYVAGTPGAQVGQPWAKAGTVAQWDAYMAQESTNGWAGWFDLGGDTIRTIVPQNTDLPILEGQFDLAGELGSVPSEVYISVGAYGTNNNDPLRTAFMVPDGNGDGDITAEEYALISTADIVTPSFDLAGWAMMADCVAGPNVTPAGSGCLDSYDFDADGDVDLADAAAFMECVQPE